MRSLMIVTGMLTSLAFGGVKTGKLLGLHSFSTGGPSGLYEIDLGTGEPTLLHGFTDDRSEGALAVGPDGTLYAAFGGLVGRLVIIDMETGDSSPVGPFGFVDVSGLAFGPNGTLYGLDAWTQVVIAIDPETGEGTVLGATGALVGNGLTFTPDGRLYAVGFEADGAPALFTINLETGAAAEVGAFGPAFSITSSLGFVGEVLYADAKEESTGVNWLVTIDRETGQATKVGPFDPFWTMSMGGMAFLPGEGDADRDGDVDLDDFAIFQSCFTGVLDTREPLPVACVFLDADDDNDLDLTDFADFQSAFTGPNDDNE